MICTEVEVDPTAREPKIISVEVLVLARSCIGRDITP